MPDFFLDGPIRQTNFLNAEDSHHALKVLRLKEGDSIRVCSGGRRYAAVLSMEQGRALADIRGELPSSEAATRITLYQGWPKGDKLDQIVRQATELGVYRVVPVFFSRCVARPEQAGKKVERLNRIAREAAMQSGRTLIPLVEEPMDSRQLAARLRTHELALLPYELEQAQTLRAANTGARDTALIIGPEGGLTPEEVALLPAIPVTLGSRILRTETAGIAALAMLLALNDDFMGNTIE